MADTTPDAEAKRAKMLENLAKARAAQQASATERESAPDTVTTEVDPAMEELKSQLAQERKDKEDALALLDKATNVPPVAPVIVQAPQPLARLPRNMQVERSGTVSAQYSVRWPQIRGGTCEFCGVMDPSQPAQYQYKMCPHFRGMSARCTYCPENKDPDEVTYHSNLNVAEHPDKPGVIIMWCNSYGCSDAHLKRFNKATA